MKTLSYPCRFPSSPLIPFCLATFDSDAAGLLFLWYRGIRSSSSSSDYPGVLGFDIALDRTAGLGSIEYIQGRGEAQLDGVSEDLLS